MMLRPRQSLLVERTLSALDEHGNTLAVAPTGSGKTIMLSAVAGGYLVEPDAKACILAHRTELTGQNRAKFERVKPASSTPAISWFGNSLGQVKLGSDQMSLQAERAGVAAARVKYTAQAQSWGIKAPKTSGGSSNFAITVFILGNSNES